MISFNRKVVFSFIILNLYTLVTNCSAQDYITNYPLSVSIGALGTNSRLEISVYDSILATTVNYNTPWVSYNIQVTGVSNGKVSFVYYNGSIVQKPLRVILYNRLKHQFITDSLTFTTPSNNRINVVCGPIWVEYYKEFDQSNYTYNEYVYRRYDYFLDKWVEFGYPLARFGTAATFYNLGQIGNCDRLFNEPDQAFAYYDPVSETKHLEIITDGFVPESEFSGEDNIFGHYDVIGSIENVMQTYDPELHQLATLAATNLVISLYDGVFIAYDHDSTDKYYMAIYDIDSHLWVRDSVRSASITNLKCEKRIITYSSQHSGALHLYFSAYNPLQKAWVKDSVPVNGTLTNVQITNGTVSWTDALGNHIRGYDQVSGWGNYPTTTLMHFVLKEFITQGYPYVYVKNYSLGTDSVFYDFGDGTISQNNRNVLWHQYTSNGTFNICLYDSSGTQSACAPVAINLCNFSGIATASDDSLCAGDTLHLAVTGNMSLVEWQYKVGSVWADFNLPGSDQLSFNLVVDSTLEIRAKLAGIGCIPNYSNSFLIFVNRAVGNLALSSNIIEKCYGETVTYIISGADPDLDFNWQHGDGTTWSNFGLNSHTAATNQNSDFVRCIVSSGTCFIDSTTIVAQQVVSPLVSTLPADTFKICGGGPVDMVASPSGTALWFNNTGSQFLAEGDTFQTVVSANTTFSVAEFDGDVIASGYADSGIGNISSGSIQNVRLRFRVDEPAYLLSLKVYPEQNGSIYVVIYHSDGYLIYSSSVTSVTNNPAGTILKCNKFLPGNAEYEIAIVCSGTNIPFKFNTSGISYPINAPGSSISILGYVDSLFHTTPDFYQIYDLHFAEGCMSSRTPILVQVFPPMVANITVIGSLGFCLGDSVRFNVSPSTALSYTWLRNGVVIPGADKYFYTARIHGAYQSIVTSQVCIDTTNIFNVRTPCTQLNPSEEKSNQNNLNDVSNCNIVLDKQRQEINFYTNAEEPQSVQLACMDPTGRIIFSNVVGINQGPGIISRSIEHLNNGLYLVRMSMKSESCTAKIIISE